MKIIINTCHGGFGLSDEAIYEYARLKNVSCTKDETDMFWFLGEHLIPKETDENWIYLYDRWAITSSDNRLRTNPIILYILESGKINCNTSFSDLKIVEIPDGIKWKIGEFAGNEWVYEEHRTWS